MSSYMWGNHRFRMIVIALIALVCLASILIFKFNLGLDLQGGMRLVLQAREVPNVKFTPDLLDGSLEVIRTRIDALGVSEPLIQRKGEKQLIVELPGIREPERAIKLVGDSAILEFATGEYATLGISLSALVRSRRVLSSSRMLVTALSGIFPPG